MSNGTVHTDISDRLRHIVFHHGHPPVVQALRNRRSKRRHMELEYDGVIFVSNSMADSRSVYITHASLILRL